MTDTVIKAVPRTIFRMAMYNSRPLPQYYGGVGPSVGSGGGAAAYHDSNVSGLHHHGGGLMGGVSNSAGVAPRSYSGATTPTQRQHALALQQQSLNLAYAMSNAAGQQSQPYDSRGVIANAQQQMNHQSGATVITSAAPGQLSSQQQQPTTAAATMQSAGGIKMQAQSINCYT